MDVSDGALEQVSENLLTHDAGEWGRAQGSGASPFPGSCDAWAMKKETRMDGKLGWGVVQIVFGGMMEGDFDDSAESSSRARCALVRLPRIVLRCVLGSPIGVGTEE
jgi:hypothetical protein